MPSPSSSQASEPTGIKAVVIGGGTGSFMLLSALRHYASDLTAIINMSDDGGSTGVLRDELGALPPGDIRQCLVALSNTPTFMRQLFAYRFDEGSLKGHAFGNLFLTALEKISGSFAEGVKMAEHILNVQGRVIPVATENVSVVAMLPNGEQIVGQSAVDEYDFKGVRARLALQPRPPANPEAVQGIMDADLVIVAPGDLYSSIIPALLPSGIGEAFRDTSAKRIYVANLVNKPRSTKDMSVHDYVMAIEGHLEVPAFDYVIYNTAEPSRELASKYLHEGEVPVRVVPEEFREARYKAIGERLLAGGVDQSKADVLIERNLIRHDGNRVARTLMRLYFR